MPYTAHTISPDNHPAAQRLVFSVEIPTEWQKVPLPQEQVDFSEPDKFLPLAIFMAPYGAVLFTAAARPAFDDGSVADWVEFICGKQNLTITSRSIVESRFGKALLAGTTQPSDAGEMTMRMIFIEDGGALLQFGVMAPTQIFPSLEEQLMHALASVLLLQPQGPTKPLIPGETKAAPAPIAAEDPSTVHTFKEYVIGDQLDSLEPENKFVTYFRDNGIGFTPRIHNVNAEEGHVTLAAAALESFFQIPLGWYVIDDGKRTLIFDKPSGGTQLNIALAPEGDADSIFSAIEKDTLSQNPSAEHRRIDMEGYPALVFRGLKIEGEMLDQVFLLSKHPQRPGRFLKFRLTTPPEKIVAMLNMTELILKSVRGV